jgi:hypothetical protein
MGAAQKGLAFCELAAAATEPTSHTRPLERPMDRLVKVLLNRVVDAIEQYLNAARIDSR